MADLVNIGKHDFYIKLMVDGASSRPFSAHNLDFLSHKEGEVSHKDLIIEQSRHKYGFSKTQIKKKIIDSWSETGSNIEDKIMRKSESSIEKLLRPARQKKEVTVDDLRATLNKVMTSTEPPPKNSNLDKE